MMRIILINHYAGSIQHGMEYRPYYLAKEWQRMGHHPVVIASTFSHIRMNNPQIQQLIEYDTVDGIPYVWLKSPGYFGNGIRRALNMFSFAALLRKYSEQIMRFSKPDILITSSPHPFAIYPARHIARRCGAKLIFEVRDLWPLSLVELGVMSPNHPFIIQLQWAEDYAYEHSDKVVSLLPNSAGHMVMHGMSPEKFQYIPNGIDVSGWDSSRAPVPSAHADLVRELRGQNRFILGYAGNHGIANALGPLVQAGAILKDSRVAIVFIGGGPEKINLQKLTGKLNCKNIFFLPPVPKTVIPELLSQMDALYIGWQGQPLYRFGISPNKLIDYMMAEKPVIHSIDAANDTVAEARCGFSVPPENPYAVAQAARSLMAMAEEERNAMGQRGREYVMANHDYRNLAVKFIEDAV